MWRHLANLAVVVAAVLILTSCGSPPPIDTEALSAERASELLAEGHSVEVSNCVSGLADDAGSADGVDQLVEACSRAEAMLNEPEQAPAEIAFTGPSSYGDDPELDRLWDECEAGQGESCDLLWEQAPLDSDYERFGVTCGEREEVLNCSELTTADPDADDSAGPVGDG